VASRRPAPARDTLPPVVSIDRPDVAILIALPEELRTLADEYADRWNAQPNPDYHGSDFVFEGPNGYRCVAAIMPRMGPTLAGQVSQRLLAWRPAVIVNVGLAGGFVDDLRIGDVIVPRQVDAYDETGKYKDTGWQLRGSDYRPSPNLLTDVQELEFANKPAHRAWADVGARTVAELRAGPDAGQVEGLLARKRLRERPLISTNHLASGSFVVASKPFAEFIRTRNADVHAGEMEAAGMMAAAEYRREPVQTLVVRGIADHVDVDKAEVDRIGEGTLRRLAMANAWRLVSALMELGKLPRTSAAAPAQTRQEAIQKRQEHWEIRLLGNALGDEIRGAADKKREALYGVSFVRPVRVKGIDEALEWLQEKFERLHSIAVGLTKLMTDSVKAAIGQSGSPPDENLILYVAKKVGEGYKTIADCVLDLRSAHTADELDSAVAIVEKCALGMMAQMEQWEPQLNEAVQQAANAIGTFTCALTLDFSHADELNDEIARLGLQLRSRDLPPELRGKLSEQELDKAAELMNEVTRQFERGKGDVRYDTKDAPNRLIPQMVWQALVHRAKLAGCDASMTSGIVWIRCQ
jgi:nucleoside phosphorylase